MNALAQLPKDLQGCADELDHGLKALHGASAAGLGFDFLDGSCKHFQGKWEYGLKKVQECVKTLHEGLDQVQQSYAQTEQGLSSALGASSS
ncbi:hypothetical protein E6W39_12000 [Kitasatospora acidiphila]|uniref:Excreted virulence factor EspC, type VII ESX diderm n=1 Tax=Kitasatospora acidiphila TaxID=2567942 RepID=A0A540W1E4_9ACTN|nr:hypothetical protein [Kitasatospora acidiphila]TQF02849.1 hypothetical protein E6W39_12000 [Kitasatospora acidiphila]